MRLPFRYLNVILLLVLAGCGSPGNLRPVPVAGGRVVGIPFGPGGPLRGRADGFEVIVAGLAPGAKDHQVVYQFAFIAPPGAVLQRVQIDDISEEQSGPLIDVEHPRLERNTWHITSAPIESTDPLLKWVYHVTPSVRVFRFTITDSTSRKSVLHQVTVYPDHYKSAIRRKWGEKY